MDAIVEQVQSLAADADENTHRKIVDTMRSLLRSIERPGDTVLRLAFQHFELAVARIATETKMLDILSKNGKPMTVAELAEKTAMAPMLTGRLLRYLAANSIVEEVSEGNFGPNNITHSLILPGTRAGLGFGMDIVSISAQALPKYLEDTKYQDIKDIDHCAWKPGHEPNLNVFQYIFSHPRQLEDFNTFMTQQRLEAATFLDSYPLGESLCSEPVSPSEVLFCDIGGGVGHMCHAFRQRYPDTRGRIVLQDLPETISTVPVTTEFEATAHDYYTPQPIKEARFYYLRNILHNVADPGCLKILKLTKAAMDPGSRILVDEIVLPTKGVHWRPAQLDMLMMSAVGAIERTDAHWNRLVDQAGLKIVGQYPYNQEQGDAVIEIVCA